MEQKMETVSDLGKLFIGGISWDTDEERLREYFSKYGDLVESVIMRDRTTGRARGFGFIVFADPSVAERVIMDKHIIDGRTVEAKKAVPRDDQQVLKRHASPMHLISSSPSHGGGNSGRTKKIFVGGLPSSITEAEFKNYFDQFGTIADVVVMYDHNTQRPRGFGFITFDSEESVEMVLHKTFHELNGKMVEVKRAVPKEQPSSSSSAALPAAAANRSSPVIGYGGNNNYGGVVVPPNRSSGGNSYFNSFAPGYNSNNNIGPPGSRFSPIGSGRNAFSNSFGLGLNQELSLMNSSFDGNAIGYNNRMIPGNQYFNSVGGASPNRYNSPIGFNRGDSAYNPSNRDLWGNRTDSSGGPGWNLGVSVGNNNNRGNWGISDTNGYGRSFGASSGLSALSLSGSNNNNNTNGFDGSIGELYRGNSVYSDSTWQQAMPHQSSNELDGLSRSYGFGFDNVASSDPSGNASEGYPGSYSVGGGNRQTNRGIEA